MYAGPHRSSEELALLKVRWVLIVSIDDVRVMDDAAKRGPLFVLPGSHKIGMILDGDVVMGGASTIEYSQFLAEPGRAYILTREDFIWRPKIIDAQTKKSVGVYQTHPWWL